jgi:anti-sigma factor RsiW
VFDLGADGFALAGGRIEHLDGRAVAALAYARDRHLINVYVWPGTARVSPQRSTRRGYNLLHWADGAMQVWAVSDLERSEMERFAALWLARSAAQ